MNSVDPERFLRPFKNDAQPEWEGFNPVTSSLYPNEIHADYAYLPFGAGARKCVGDQFALMEAVITLAVTLRDFNFALATKPEEVGIYTGATIHTRNGLMMKVTRRARGMKESSLSPLKVNVHVAVSKEDSNSSSILLNVEN